MRKNLSLQALFSFSGGSFFGSQHKKKNSAILASIRVVMSLLLLTQGVFALFLTSPQVFAEEVVDTPIAAAASTTTADNNVVDTPTSENPVVVSNTLVADTPVVESTVVGENPAESTVVGENPAESTVVTDADHTTATDNNVVDTPVVESTVVGENPAESTVVTDADHTTTTDNNVVDTPVVDTQTQENTHETDSASEGENGGSQQTDRATGTDESIVDTGATGIVETEITTDTGAQLDTGTQAIINEDTHSKDQNDLLFLVTVNDNELGFVRVREKATTSSDEIDKISAGTSVGVVGMKEGFYKVVVQGVEGRISTEYVSIIDTSESASHEGNNNNTKEDEELKRDTPTGSIELDTNGMIKKESIQSYNIQSTEITYCSYITRLNLEKITGLKSAIGLAQDNNSISQGDAIDLILQGVKEKRFQSFDYTQNEKIQEYLNKAGYTVWDVYAYHNTPGLSKIERGHRFTMFKSEDQWYVLDPVVGHTTAPLALSDYLLLLQNYDSTVYLPSQGYYPATTTPTESMSRFLKKIPKGEFASKEYNQQKVRFYKVALGGESNIVINKFVNQERLGYDGLLIADQQGEPMENNTLLKEGEIVVLTYSSQALGKAGYELRASTLSLYDEIVTLSGLKKALSEDSESISSHNIKDQFKVFVDQGKITIKFFDEIVDGYKEGDRISLDDAKKELAKAVVQKKELSEEIERYADRFDFETGGDKKKETEEKNTTNTISDIVDTIGSEIVDEVLNENDKNIVSVKVQGATQSFEVPQDRLQFQAGSLEALITPLQDLDPGDYTVSVTITNPLTNEEQVFTQTLSWGVIAINTNKDTYSVGENVYIDLGILDEQGYPTCDATVQGTVIGPDGSSQLITVTKNDTCGLMEEGYIQPDFSTQFIASQEGDYFLSIDATTENGTQHIYQRVQVLSNSPYTTTRVSATRNFPYGKTPMSIHIQFNQAFQGTITEYAPTSFDISTINQGGTTTLLGNRQAIQWNITAQAGEEVVLTYMYDAPDISPEFYILGPLNFFDQQTLAQYNEKRVRQIANDEYTQNNNNGEFVLTTLTNFIGIDLSNTVNVFADTSLGVIRLNNGATTGYFQTIDINPSSMYGWKTLSRSGNGSPSSLEIRDCSNAVLTTIIAPTSPLSLSGISALSGVTCIRVRMYLIGDSTSPQFSQVKATWNPKPIMSINISGPATLNAGSCSDYTISWQNSFVDDTGVVLYIQLPSRMNGSVYNYNTGYGQYSGGNFYDPYFPGGYYGTGAPYSNPLGLPISLNGKYTSTSLVINGTTIPANSIYWDAGFVSAGTTSNYKFLLCSRVGTQSGTTFSLSGFIDGALSEPGTNTTTTKILSIPGKQVFSTLSNSYSCDGTIKLSQYNTNKVVTYTHYVYNYQGGAQTETIFNPTLDYNFTDIINKLQTSCGVPDYTSAISRFSFVVTGGTWSGSNYIYGPSSFTTGWLLPSAIKYFNFTVDYSGCNTSGTTLTYTGTFDGDNITPLSLSRTLTIGECNVNVGQFVKYPTFASNPYSYGQAIPYTLQFNNTNGDRKGMVILYDKLPADVYLDTGATINGATGYIYYSTLGASNNRNNPPSYDTGTMFSGDAGPNWTTTFSTGAVWVMAAIPHMNSTLFPIPADSPQYNIPYYTNLNFNGVIKSTGACSLLIRNTGAFEIRQRTNTPDSSDTGLVTLTTPLIGSYVNSLPAVPNEIRPIIQNPTPNNRFSPLSFLTYSVSSFLGVGTYTQTGTFVMTGTDGTFTGGLIIPLPLLNVNGVAMYPSLSSITLLRNGVPYSPYTTTATTSGSTPGNSSIILSFENLQTGTYTFGLKLNIPHGFFIGGTTVVQLTGVNTCAAYSGKTQLTINPIQGSQIIKAFKYRETPISAPDGIIQYTLNTQSLGNWYTTNTFIIDKVPANTTFVSAQTSGVTANLQVFNCEGCRVYFYSGATLPPSPTSGFIFGNFATGINTAGVRTSPFPSNQVTYVAYKIDNPNTIPPNVFPVGTGNRVGMRVQTSSGATDGLVITNEYKVISDQLLPTNSNKVETIVSTINIRDLILNKEGQSVGVDELIGTADDVTGSAEIGKDIRYSLTYISNSSSGADDVSIVDPIPANTCFKVGSLSNTYPPIAHTLSYSDNGGTSFVYSPVGGTGSYDCAVTHIKITFNQSINAGRIGKFIFDVRVDPGFTGNSILNNATIIRSGTEINTANNTGSYTLPLYWSDLYINKSVNKSLTYPLDTLQYTLDYGNLGPDTATSVVITDILPNGFIYTSSTPSGVLSGNQIIFTTGSLGVGQTGRVIVNGTISGGLISGSVLNNTVSIRSLSNDTNTGNNTSSGTTVIRDRQSDLVIIKNPSILTGLSGATLNYGITYRNYGPDSAPNVIITDTLPTGFVYSSSSPAGVKVGNTITWSSGQLASLGTLGTGFTGVINIFGSISGQAQSGDRLINVVTINSTSETNTGNNISTGITFVRGKMVDLVITKSVNLTGGYTGNALTYTLQYRNYGPDNAINAIITDTLPTGFVYSSSFPAGVLSGNTLTWSSGQIGSFANYGMGSTGTITINGSISGGAQSGDILFNQAFISNNIPESNPNNNSGSASTLVKNRFADLVITKTPNITSGYAGSNLSYTITYRNYGPDVSPNTLIVDTLPSGFVYSSSTPAGVLSGNTLTWSSAQIATLGNLTMGFTGSIIINGSISGSYHGNQRLHNIVSISGSYIDPNTGNNQATGSTFVNPKADIRVVKTQSTGLFFSGEKVTYTLSYYNAGNDTGTNVTITDTRPSELLFISASVGYTFIPTNKYQFTIGTLPVGVTGTIILTGLVVGSASGTKVFNGVVITGSEFDPVTGNNSTGVTGTIIDRYFDLELDKALNNTDPIYSGDKVGFTITVINKGPHTGYNITVADLLPIGLTYLSHMATQGLYDQNVGLWYIGTLGVMQSVELLLIGTSTSVGTFVNYAQIAGYSGGVDIDSTGGNNSGTGINADEDDDDAVKRTTLAKADVTIIKSASITGGHTGDIVSFALEYSNSGSGNAMNVSVIDTLPSWLVYASSYPAGVVSGNTVVRTSDQIPTLGNLSPGSSGIIYMNAYISSGASSGQIIINNADITTTTPETNTGNNNDTASIIVYQWITDLEITKTPNIQTGYAGDSIKYTIRYHNNGPDRGINTIITDTLPEGFIYDYSVPSGVLSGNVLTRGSGEIPMFYEKFFPGDSGYITIYGSIDPNYPGDQRLHNPITITSTIPESNTGNNQATGSIRVLPVADLGIKKGQSSSILYSGELMTYTLYYYNNGKDTGTNVTITDHWPVNEIQFVSASMPHSFSGPNYYSFIIPVLPAGSGGEITVTGLVLGVASGTRATNYALISGNELDPNRGNNETKISAIIYDPYFDLELDKNLINTGTISVGQHVGYTITVVNQGAFTGYNITVTDLLPIGLNYISHLVTQGLYDPSQGLWLIGTLGVMQSVTLTLTGQTTQAGSITNYAQVSSYNGGVDIDSTGGNNSGTGGNADEDDDNSVTITVLNPVNVKVTKQATVATGRLGGSVSWVISYENQGPGTANDVTITDIVPAGLTYTGSNISGTAIRTNLSGDVAYLFTLGTLSPGATGQITVWTRIDSGYNISYTNYASINTTSLDTNSGDNQDTDTIGVTSSFLGVVDPYICGSSIAGRITNTGNGVEYVKISILTTSGLVYKEFYPTLDANNNFVVSIDYINTLAASYILSGGYTIQYTLKELSGKVITGSYSAFITNMCVPGGGGGGGPTPPVYFCGDGIVDTTRGEQCEPRGFNVPGKTCNASCQIINNPPTPVPYCGDGIVQPSRGEQCELGSLMSSGWSCNNQCKAIKIITNNDPIPPVIHQVAEVENTEEVALTILPKTGADR